MQQKVQFEPSAYLGIMIGQFFLICSGIFYSIAWFLNYGQQLFMADKNAALFFNISVGSGLIGCIWLFISVKNFSRLLQTNRVNIFYIALSAIVFFVLTWFFTEQIFHRVFTTELVIIPLLAALEFSCVFVLSGIQLLDTLQTRFSIVLLGLSVIIGLASYCLHFVFRGQARFINGLVPYGFAVLTLAIIEGFFYFDSLSISPNKE